MTSLAEYQPSKFIKALYIGASSTGKTGSLASLVKAGYKLRILDFDNGVAALKQFVLRDCPELINNVDVITLRDKYKAGANGPIISGVPTAYTTATKLLGKWEDGSSPEAWGQDHILIWDSLTFGAKAAFNWADILINPGARDRRNIYKTAQDSIEYLMALLTADNFMTNVIVISHISYHDYVHGTEQTATPDEKGKPPPGSILKGFPRSIGKALDPYIGGYFNELFLAESVGSGAGVRRTIKTVSTGTVDLKTSAPFKLKPELPLETGLATIFNELQEKETATSTTEKEK